MSPKEIGISVAKRNADDGNTQIMPYGSKISAESAVQRFAQGERGILPKLENEPLFTRFNHVEGKFTVQELRTEDVGTEIRAMADNTGFMPGLSGVNSLRRAGIVAMRRGLETNGLGIETLRRFAAHSHTTKELESE